MINGLWYVPITQNSEVNPNQHTEPENKTANLATEANGRIQFTNTEELNTARHQNSTNDIKMTPKTANESRATQFVANVTTPTPTFSQAELALYHHQSLGNPRKDTMLRALRKHPTQFQTFPGLSYELVSTHLPPSEATEKIHIIMTRKGLRSTRTMTKKLVKARHNISNFLPAEEVCLAEEDEIYCYAILGDSNISGRVI